MFGVGKMYQRKAIEQAIAYENIYNEEATELDNIDFASDFLSKIIARNEEAVRISVGYSYINWLKSFTDEYGDFSTLDSANLAPIISEEDERNINVIDIFYDVIDEYVTENRISISREEEGDYSYQISYLDNGFKIGFIPGQNGVFYCETIMPDENTIDFTDIVEYTSKQLKTRKRTI